MDPNQEQVLYGITDSLAGNQYPKTEYVSSPDTSAWYSRKQGCIKGVDPTEITRKFTFPGAMLGIGIPLDPAPYSRICTNYVSSSPLEDLDPSAMMETAQNYPQFAFRPRGPNSTQVDVESQLRRLDQRLTKMQAVIAEDAPLFRNTVQPPQPEGVRQDVLNASNPISSIIRPGAICRDTADAYAVQKSGLRFNNTTRQDTQLYTISSNQRTSITM
jgi:hypothetical protein